MDGVDQRPEGLLITRVLVGRGVGQARKAIRQGDKQSQCRAGSRLQLRSKPGMVDGCKKAQEAGK